MKVRDAQKLTVILFIIGIIIMLAALLYEPLLIIGAVVTISCLIPHFLYNKCPHCGKHLGRDYGKFCQHCGEKIDQPIPIDEVIKIKKANKNTNTGMALGMCFGISIGTSIGTSIGLSLGNVAMGSSTGMLFGMVIGLLIGAAKDNEDK